MNLGDTQMNRRTLLATTLISGLLVVGTLQTQDLVSEIKVVMVITAK